MLVYAVARSTNEIGIRMVLGAQRGDVLRLILRRGLFAIVTALASYMPARRAARVDPMEAIRCE